MKCPSCDNALDEAARFCGHCGHRLAPTPAGKVVIGPKKSPRPELQGSAEPAPQVAKPPAAQRAAAPQPNGTPQPPARGNNIPARSGAMGSSPQVGTLATQAPAKPAPAPAPTPKPPAGPVKDPFIGTVLNNRYHVETKLGQGGFGAVYKGRQTLAGREVALKVLHPDMARDPNLLARFRREGAVACNLRDAHTVTTYDFDQTPDGVLYIAMELLTGKSLHDIFYDEAPLPARRVLKVLEQMCSSLGEAHRQGIVHRDIKPENIYLEDRPGYIDYVKVLDFGIAKIIRGDIGGSNAPQLTATGQTLGTLEYMSPEQLMGKQLDGRSDIYAMGVLAYELLTGHLPFPDANGPAELIAAQLKKIPSPPGTANPSGDISTEVDAIVLRMLEKDRGKRYQDVDELSRDIGSVLQGNGRATGPNGVLSSGLTPPPVLVPAQTPPPVITGPPSIAGVPRPYALAPPTEEKPVAEHKSRAVLYALITVVLLAAALVSLYFGVLRK